MTKEQAIEFFSDFYGGEHHIPRSGVKEYGFGWCVNHDRGELASYDYNELTRLVFAAHDKCYRVSVSPLTPSMLRISIWERKREGGMSSRHPTLEQAVYKFRARFPATN